MKFLDHEDVPWNYWLGGSDMDHEGRWIWLNSGQIVEDFIWATGM